MSPRNPAAAAAISSSIPNAATESQGGQQPDGSAGGVEAGGTDAGDGEREKRVLYGSGGRRRGHGKVRSHVLGEKLNLSQTNVIKTSGTSHGASR